MKSVTANRPIRSLLALAIALAASTSAIAGPANKVYRPIVEKGETEFEFRGGYRAFGGGADEYSTTSSLCQRSVTP